MSDTIAGGDPPPVTESSKSGFDASRIAEVKAWLSSQFDAADKDVPDFEYTPRTIAYLYNLATISQSKTQAAAIVANDFRQKAAEYRSQGNSKADLFKKAMLNRVGYNPEISHGVLVEMAEHRKELEKKTKLILDTLRSYQDLPPDKALAALAIEDKKRQYAAAEKYLEDILQSALAPTE